MLMFVFNWTAGKALMKPLILFVIIIIILLGLTASYSQEVTVRATTNKKEVEAILKKEQEEARVNRAFFTEHDRCRGLLRQQEWVKAEASCRAAITLVENLPKEHVLERSSVRATLAIAMLWQRRPEEAVLLLDRSLEIRKTVSDDTDADTGDLYFLLGQTHSLLNNMKAARSYYEKAESTYRAAFVEIGDDDFRVSYSRRLRNTVETHYNLVKSAGLVNEAEKLQVRLVQVEKEFAKYLIN